MVESSHQHWETFWSESHFPAEANAKISQVLISLGDPSGWKVLEVGAGRGVDSVYLAKRGVDGYVLDYSRAALAVSESLASEQGVKLNLVEADALEIPFETDTFDVVFHQGFLEHFRDTGPVLLEQRRVLKPGGFVLVDVPQRYSLYTIKKQLAIRRGAWFAGWETQFGPRQLQKIVSKAGFDIIGRYAWGMALSYGWGVRNMLHRMKNLARKKRGETEESGGESSSPGEYCSSEPFTPWPFPYLADNVGVVGRKIA